MATFDTDGELGIDSTGYRTGQQYFRSFLLAGERHLTSGFSRPNSDESRFKDFFAGLDPGQQAVMKSYFTRQRDLSPTLRAKVVGLDNVRIETPLTMRNTAPEVVLSRGYQGILRQIVANRATAGTTAIASVAPATGPNTLRLYLTRLKVEDSQDKTIFGLNSTDEISLGIISTDETGDVGQNVVTVGDIKEGNAKTFPNPGLKLVGFNMLEGTTYPKFYSAIITGIERDGGGYNKIIAKAAEYVKDKVTKELLAQGITAGGAYFGITVPPAVASFIANVVKGYFDSFIDWLTGLFNNDDDIVGSVTRTATISSLAAPWSSGTLVANSKDHILSGSDGRYRITTHWEKVRI